MFWKIFAWTNLFTSLPLSLVAGFYSMMGVTTIISLVINLVVFVFNNLFLAGIPLLFAYKIYNIKYLSNALFLKMIVIFMILYNTTNIVSDLTKYNFISVPGVFLDTFFYVSIILSIVSFVLYIMEKYKISFFHVFLK